MPGANAAITAIASSGLPTHNFVFLGFPPKGKNAFRNILVSERFSFKGSLIFYQSKYKCPLPMKFYQKSMVMIDLLP